MNRRFLLVLLLFVLFGLVSGASAEENSYSLWFVDYWDNPNLAGDPVAGASTGVIDYDWGSGSPEEGVPIDGWSGQWRSIVEFSPGTYRFTSHNDDGIRVFVGDKHIITDWNTHPLKANVVSVSLLGGKYPMAVDFYDEVGGATLRLGWERTGPPESDAADVTVIPAKAPPPTPQPAPQTTWRTEYWNNTDLSGTPAVTRNEVSIDDDWGSSSPAPGIISADEFSGRWSRFVYFNSGTYLFTAESDDGIRASIGGNQIIDDWSVHPLRSNSSEVALAAGTYLVVVEYFEDTHLAMARFGWERVVEDPSELTGVTATTTPYGLSFRTGPGTDHTRLDVIRRGATLPVVGRSAGDLWLQVEYLGDTGWVSARYTTVEGDLASVPVTG